MLLFDPMFFVAGGVTLGVALIDKILESFGFYFLQDLLKIIVPLAGLALGVYFIENNPLLGWFK